jgi:deoxyribonuclease-4
MLLGLHLPTRFGYERAFEDAKRLGCRSLQIFIRRPGASLEGPGAPLGSRDGGIESLLVHRRFAPAPGSSDDDWRRRAVEKLGQELKAARELGADAFILHLGAFSPGSDFGTGLSLALESLAQAASQVQNCPAIAIENVPGGGRRMGSSFEELARCQEAAPAGLSPLGYCLDTAHAWGAGEPLSTPEGMLAWIERAESLLGRENLLAFHLNDSRAALGSRRDDHIRWGGGHLGLGGLRALLSLPQFARTPGILEVDGPLEDRGRSLQEAENLLKSPA